MRRSTSIFHSFKMIVAHGFLLNWLRLMESSPSQTRVTCTRLFVNRPERSSSKEALTTCTRSVREFFRVMLLSTHRM
jgi:hypothetical protein